MKKCSGVIVVGKTDEHPDGRQHHMLDGQAQDGDLVLDIIQGKTTMSEASQAYDLTPSEVEEGKRHGERELLGWHLSRRGRSKTAESALDKL